MTPLYAAPEQLEGASVTTATDVYSLGMLLWLLVVGRNPRATHSVRSLAELRALANREPTTLFQAITSPQAFQALESLAKQRGTSSVDLLKTLRGDLDSILRKAVAMTRRIVTRR